MKKLTGLFILVSTFSFADSRYVCDSIYQAIEYSLAGTFIHATYHATAVNESESTARYDAWNDASSQCLYSLGQVYACHEVSTTCRTID